MYTTILFLHGWYAHEKLGYCAYGLHNILHTPLLKISIVLRIGKYRYWEIIWYRYIPTTKVQNN